MMMEQAAGALDMLGAASANLYDHPVETVAAVGAASAIPYFFGACARVWRQRGHGGMLDKIGRGVAGDTWKECFRNK